MTSAAKEEEQRRKKRKQAISSGQRSRGQRDTVTSVSAVEKKSSRQSYYRSGQGSRASSPKASSLKERSASGRLSASSSPKKTEPRSSRNHNYDEKLQEKREERRRSAGGTKAAERRRIQRAARRNLYLKISLIVLVVLGLLAGGIALYRSNVFLVKTVAVTGVKQLTSEEVASLAGVPKDATMLRFPGKAVEQRVGANPWVEQVTVSRGWPSTLNIAIVERVPAAVVTSIETTDTWTISDKGYWVEPSKDETSTLVTIEGSMGLAPKEGQTIKNEAIINALTILEGVDTELKKQIETIKAESVAKTELVLKDGVSIFFGSADRLEEKDKIARELLKEHAGNVVYINVRVPESAGGRWRNRE